MSRKLTLLLPCISAFAALLALIVLLEVVHAAPQAALLVVTSSPTWQVACLDCPAIFKPIGDRYLQTDSSRMPHMVFTGEGQLYHAWLTSSGWQHESIPVDGLIVPPSSTSVTSAALAFDAQDNLHIAFILNYPGNSTLYLYTRNAAAISYELIFNFVGNEASVTSIGIDSNGYAHIPFYDSAEQKLRYAYQTPSGWNTSAIIDTGEYIGFTTSFVLDAQSYGHLAYYANKAGSGLRYAYQDPVGWHIETVDPDLIGLSLSLALDADGNPHISYYHIVSHSLKHAYHDHLGWHIEMITVTGALGADSSLAFNLVSVPGSGLCVAYSDTLAFQLIIACRTAIGTWNSNVLANERSLAPSLLFGPDGAFQVASLSQETGWLQMTYMADSELQSDKVMQSVSLSGPIVVEIDQAGFAHVLYHQSEPTQTVRLAVEGASGWHTGTVTTTLGICEDMALDRAGNPHLACVTSSNRLVYAHLGASGWQTQTIDHLASQAAYLSITVDAGNHAHLSYADDLENRLVYGNNAAGNIITETANATYSGSFTSLALDSGGRPYISYLNPAGNPEIMYKGATGWQLLMPFPSLIKTTTTNTVLTENKFTSLALDSHDRVHLAYLEYAGICRLRYVYQDALGWHTDVIDQDPINCTGLQPTLKLDDAGNPQVSYHIELDKTSNLKFAFKDQQGWHLQTIDINAGEFSSLGVGPGNKAWIAYLDISHHDVKIAYTLSGTILRFPIVINNGP